MPDFARARAAMRAIVGHLKEQDPAEFCLSVAELVSDARDVPILGHLAQVGALLKALHDSGDIGVAPNPFFVTHGFDDTDSPKTARYLRGRALKGAGGTGLLILGGAASAGTAGINVAAAIQHGGAVGTSAMHLQQLLALAMRAQWRGSVTIQDWLRTCILAKTVKLSLQGAGLAADVVPAASLPAAIAAFAARTGYRVTLGKAVRATAMAIHWRAFQEQAVSGGLHLGVGRHVGPASEIFFEIFTKRGLTAAFGRYDTAALVQEPAGWQALADKLLLL